MAFSINNIPLMKCHPVVMNPLADHVTCILALKDEWNIQAMKQLKQYRILF